MVKVTVFVEGGGRGRLATVCRKGFSEFFKNAGLAGHMPSIVACGSRNDAFERFCVAVSDSGSGDVPLLLVDSEYLVRANDTPWQHLRSRDSWKRPDSSQDNQANLMVQCMETWLLADVSGLETFFGPGFTATSLSKRDDIEKIPKNDVLNQLTTASRPSRKGTYHKGLHSFEILAQIDQEKVIQRSRFAKRLVETLKGHLNPI